MSSRRTPLASRRTLRRLPGGGQAVACAFLVTMAMVGGVHAQPEESDETRFVTYDVRIDPGGRHLAAYQLEIRDLAGVARIVGIEGGTHPAFTEPPYYDPRAIQQERVVLAAFQLDDDVPSVKTRVATLHVEIPSDVEPQFDVQVEAASDRDGDDISIAAEVTKRDPQ